MGRAISVLKVFLNFLFWQCSNTAVTIQETHSQELPAAQRPSVVFPHLSMQETIELQAPRRPRSVHSVHSQECLRAWSLGRRWVCPGGGAVPRLPVGLESAFSPLLFGSWASLLCFSLCAWYLDMVWTSGVCPVVPCGLCQILLGWHCLKHLQNPHSLKNTVWLGDSGDKEWLTSERISEDKKKRIKQWAQDKEAVGLVECF